MPKRTLSTGGSSPEVTPGRPVESVWTREDLQGRINELFSLVNRYTKTTEGGNLAMYTCAHDATDLSKCGDPLCVLVALSELVSWLECEERMAVRADG